MNEIKKGAFIGYISVLLNAIIVVFLTPFLLKNLGTSDYGIYTLIASVMAYFNVLDLGLGSTAVRYIAKNYQDKEQVSIINGCLIKVYLMISVLTIVLGVILYFSSGAIFLSLTTTELVKFKISLMIMVVTLAITFPLSVCSSYIMAYEKFTFQKLLSLIQNIAKPLLMVPMVLLGYKSIAMIVILAFINLSVCLTNYLYAKTKLDFKVKYTPFKNNTPLLKEMFSFSAFILIMMVVDTVFNNTDQVILAAYCGTLAVSIYNSAAQFKSTNTNLSSVISQLYYPKLTKMVAEKRPMKEISAIFLRVARIQLYILMLVFSGFLIFGRQFISLWIGADFLDAYYITLIFLAPSLIPLSQNIGIYLLQAMNRHKFRAMMFFGIAILNIAISIPLSIHYAGVGAAIGSAIAILLGQIITMNIYYYKAIKLDIKKYWVYFIKIVLPITIVSIPLSLVLKNHLTTWTTLFLAIGIYALCYVIYIYLVLFDAYEKDIFKGVVKKVMRIIKNILRKGRDYLLYRNFITEHLIPVKNRVILESKPDFADNTYSLYLEMLKNNYQEKYEIIWLVTNDNIPANFRNEKVKYYNINKKGIVHFFKFQYLLNTAKFIITCNRVFKRKTKRQTIIYLDHGTPLKDLTKLKMSYGHVDGTVVLSDFFIEASMKNLNTTKNQYIVAGFPRNDGLYTEKNISKILKIKTKKYLVWLPTFRQYEDNKRIDSTFEMPLGIPIVYKKEDLDKLNTCLKKNDITLIIKPHFAAKINNIEVSYSNITIMTNKTLDEFNLTLYELLGKSDGLITDYSSVYYDYLITEKPIALTLDDFEDYKEHTGFIYDYYDIIKGDYVYTLSDLETFVENIHKNIDNSLKERKNTIKRLSLDTRGSYSEKMLKILQDKYHF